MDRKCTIYNTGESLTCSLAINIQQVMRLHRISSTKRLSKMLTLRPWTKPRGGHLRTPDNNMYIPQCQGSSLSYQCPQVTPGTKLWDSLLNHILSWYKRNKNKHLIIQFTVPVFIFTQHSTCHWLVQNTQHRTFFKSPITPD